MLTKVSKREKQGMTNTSFPVPVDIDLLPLVTLAEKMGADYFDFRIVTMNRSSIESRNGELVSAVSGTETGGAVRMLWKGTWGYFSTNDISKNGLTFAIEQARNLASATRNKNSKKIQLSPVRVYKDVRHHKVKKDPQTVDIETKFALLKDMHSSIHRRKYIASVDSKYEDTTRSTYFISSEGSEIFHDVKRVTIQSNIVARDGANVVGYRDRIGATSGFEYFNEVDPAERIKDSAKAAVRILKAKAAPSGNMPVVADPDLTGVFVHEAVGHATESDLVASGESILEGRLGKKIGSSLVTIVDDPNIRGGFGSFVYDDEGVRAKKKILIKKGKLNSFINNRETAAEMGLEANGGARAESYSVRPLVRMSNTVMQPGTMDFNELISDIKKGIYAIGTRGGQVDTAKGTFQFNAQEAYLIVNGEVTKPLRDVSLSGDILKTLSAIDGVGKDKRLGTPGYCGKGQIVPVGDGGPHIRIKKVLVGGG